MFLYPNGECNNVNEYIVLGSALWHINAETSEWQDAILEKTVAQDSLMLRTHFSMISTGTERLVAKGEVPMSMQNIMGVPYMDGAFSLPIKFGYACGGQSDEGKVYHYMHPHQDVCILKKDALFELNNGLAPHKIPLVSNMETVLNAIWDSEYSETSSIAICGFGNVGSLLANTLRLYAEKEVDVLEKDTWRKDKAQSMGWNANAEEEKRYDIIFHTTGTSAGLQYCIDHLNEEGKVIELSWYGTKKVSLSLGEAFHYKRLSIKSSQVSKVSPIVSHKIDYTKRKEIAADLLLDSSYDELIANVVSKKEVPLLFKDLRNNSMPNGLIWLIKYN